MSTVGQPERATQERVIALFRDELGYRDFGNRSDFSNNSNIEEPHLSQYLTRAGYTVEQISRTLYRLRVEADNANRSLYDNNKVFYSLLRYGVPVKVEAGKVTETVNVINWTRPEIRAHRQAARLGASVARGGGAARVSRCCSWRWWCVAV